MFFRSHLFFYSISFLSMSHSLSLSLLIIFSLPFSLCPIGSHWSPVVGQETCITNTAPFLLRYCSLMTSILDPESFSFNKDPDQVFIFDYFYQLCLPFSCRLLSIFQLGSGPVFSDPDSVFLRSRSRIRIDMKFSK